jgi:predicted ATPase
LLLHGLRKSATAGINQDASEDESPMDEEVFAFGSFRLIPAQRMLSEDGKPVRIGARALDILAALTERASETISKEELIARAWPGTVVEEAALRVHVAALRKALGDGRAGKRFIANLSGRGYAFIAPVTRENALPATAAPTGMAEVGNVPAPLTRVVGRDDVISKLAQQLVRRRFLTIVGPGGIGKTTVAVAIADAVRASYSDGAWYVELASLSDSGLVLSAVCALLGITLAGVNLLSGLTASLRNKHILIVLDSCEHVIGAAAALAEAILKAAPQAGILATSREPLRAEGEWLHRLAPLELPPQARTSPTAVEALGYSAVELFNERASATMDRFVLDDADVPAVLEICRRLDGVPLALELAAARVDAFGVSGLAARLDDRFGVLTSGRRTALPRQQTLRATIDWSYELLSDAERVILRRLAVFRGAFTIAAAVAILIDGRITATDAIEGIANLAEKSLITTDITGNISYHRLLDTTRLYALLKLAESGERGTLARRHAEYFRDGFEQAEAEWETRPAAEWLADYGPQIDNLRAALDWAFSPHGDTSIGVALAAAAVPLWTQLSLMAECRGRVKQALAALTAGSGRDTRREMKLHAALGASLNILEGPTDPETGAAWTKALEIAECLDDAEYRLRSLGGLWFFHSGGGRYRVALALAERFCTLAANRPDRLIGERLIGASLFYLGDLPSARRHLERVLAGYVTSHQRHIIGSQLDLRVMACVFLARILWLQGFPDQAMRVAESSIEDARAANHALSLCYVLGIAACPIALWVGDLAVAEHYVRMLLDHSTRHALPVWHAWGRSHQGVLDIKRDDVTTGLRLLRAGFDELAEARSALRFITFLGEMAEALGRAGQIADGLAAIEEAIDHSERTEAGWAFAELLRVKGELLLLQGAPGAPGAAEDHFRQALDWARRQDALSWELRAARSLARLLGDQGRSADALALLQPVYDRFTEGLATPDLRAARSILDASLS